MAREFRPRSFAIGVNALDDGPEPRRMIEFDAMRNLVRYDVIAKRGRQVNQAPM